MSAVQTLVRSQLSVGSVNFQQISGQLYITLKYCSVMVMLLMNSSLMWSSLLLTVRLMAEPQYFLILVLVVDLSRMGTWMSRGHLNMLWSSATFSFWYQMRSVNARTTVISICYYSKLFDVYRRMINCLSRVTYLFHSFFFFYTCYRCYTVCGLYVFLFCLPKPELMLLALPPLSENN
jgi:hypothetical protein